MRSRFPTIAVDVLVCDTSECAGCGVAMMRGQTVYCHEIEERSSVSLLNCRACTDAEMMRRADIALSEG